MSDENNYPDCIRYHPESNSTMFAVTDEHGDVVAVHQVFLDKNAQEIGRKTTGNPELGYVKFSGSQPATIYRGQPEDGMKIWSDTGQEVWVDVCVLKNYLPGLH